MINKYLVCILLALNINTINSLAAEPGGIKPSPRINARENVKHPHNMKANESIENIQPKKDNNANTTQKTGVILSFSGFNEFRMGMGLFFGKLGSAGHHPFGTDFGLLFEYNLKKNTSYSRFYYHFTGGVGAMLLGGSMAIAADRDHISAGFAPEIGFGLSTLFKIFYRYNFFINRRFNDYEVVFHLCLYNGA
jgi:hypothetical protein